MFKYIILRPHPFHTSITLSHEAEKIAFKFHNSQLKNAITVLVGIDCSGCLNWLNKFSELSLDQKYRLNLIMEYQNDVFNKRHINYVNGLVLLSFIYEQKGFALFLECVNYYFSTNYSFKRLYLFCSKYINVPLLETTAKDYGDRIKCQNDLIIDNHIKAFPLIIYQTKIIPNYLNVSLYDQIL